MQVFKVFMKIVYSRRIVILLYTGIFLAIAVISTLTSNNSVQNEFKDTKLTIGIIDDDNTELSGILKDYLGDIHKTENIEYDKDNMIKDIYYQKYSYIIRIEKGFEQKLLSGDTNGLIEGFTLDGSYYESLVNSQTESFIKYTSALILSGNKPSEAAKKAQKLISEDTEVSVYSENNDSDNDDFIFATYFKFLTYILLSVVVSSLCPALIVLDRPDIRARTNASSLSVSSQLKQKILGTAVYSIGIWLLFMAAAFILYSSKFTSSEGLLVVLQSFVFLLTIVSLSMLVSVIAKNQKIADIVGTVVGFGMSFLCGVFVPQEYLSEGVLTAAHILPGYWYVKGIDQTIGSGTKNIDNVVICIVAELCFAAVLFALMLVISRKKRRKIV